MAHVHEYPIEDLRLMTPHQREMLGWVKVSRQTSHASATCSRALTETLCADIGGKICTGKRCRSVRFCSPEETQTGATRCCRNKQVTSRLALDAQDVFDTARELTEVVEAQQARAVDELCERHGLVKQSPGLWDRLRYLVTGQGLPESPPRVVYIDSPTSVSPVAQTSSATSGPQNTNTGPRFFHSDNDRSDTTGEYPL